MLAVTMLFSVFTPITAIAGQCDPIQESTQNESTTERGEYVIALEENMAALVSEPGEAAEISKETDMIIYETDLSEEELLQLKQSGEAVVEENFFLFGANAKEEPKRPIKGALSDGQDAQESNREGTDWNYRMIRWDEPADKPAESTDDPVKVAVLDSGIELLSGIPVRDSVNLVKEEQDLPYYMNDMVGHGTAVADIIHQICPDAWLYAVRVLDRENRGRLSDIVEGIYWCIDQDVDIINMSFGTPRESEILRDAVQAAANAGILIVGSAGNGGSEAGIEYPARFEEVVAVGAVGTDAKRTEESATGSELELVAPGEQIAVKSMFGMETVSSGTSMAAPHIAGAAAVLMEQDAQKDAVQVRAVLNESGNPLGSKEEYGSGIVDIAYAKQLLEEDVVTSQEGSVCAYADGQQTERVRDAVQTFEEVDYVEGRWGKDKHKELMQDAAVDFGDFSATEMKLLKAGAVYPDIKEAMPNDPEWHGQFWENYIANYISAVKLALLAGDTAALPKAKGQSEGCYQRIKSKVSTKNMNGKSWNAIIADTTGLDYGSQSASVKKKWRKTFLSGMACHTGTDAFAHSAYYRDQYGFTYQIEHKNGADNPDVKNNRYKCAGRLAYETAANCQLGISGDVIDFWPADNTIWKDFLMRNILEYAIQADKSNYGEKTLREWFGPIDYRVYD